MWDDIYPILLIVLAVIIGIQILLFLILIVFHNKMFGSRYERDPEVTYFMKEEFNMNMVPVNFKVKKDTLRGGIYYNNFKEYKGVIVFCHGMFSTIHSYMQDIGYFASKGYKVLAINYSGVDSSDGKNYKGFGHSLQCIDYAVRFANEHDDLKNYKISVVGHSWGGFAALNVQKYHKDINKAVVIAPFVSIKRLLKGYLPKWLHFVLPTFIFIDSLKCGKYSFANGIKTIRNKDNVLLVNSTNDHMVNYEYNADKLLKTHDKLHSIINEGRFHNPHYTMESVSLLREYSNNLKALDKEGKIDLKRNTDFHKLGMLDEDVMNQIVTFIG
jgi:pimeloyl-ACP methyl ester carboxylesterase